MYYILNETNKIIAADDNLLELCGLSHIDELSLKIALGNIQFDLIEENLIITTDNNDQTFPISKTPLSSMLGHLTLVDIKVSEEKTEENDLSVLTVDDTLESIAPLDLDSDLISIKSDLDTVSEVVETTESDSELFDLVLEDEAEISIDTIDNSLDILTEDTDILDLGLSIKEDEILKEEPLRDDHAEILIDIEKISQQIGVSHEDYDTFLNEYIDTALGLEEDLQSTDTGKCSNAIGTLSHLSDVLQLPLIGNILAKIETASVDKKREAVESFYAALSRITTSPTSGEESKLELSPTQEEIQEDIKPEVTVNEKSFGTISLEGIKPIHFDFQLEQAANDLSLPVELIEEFVHDFIEQAHVETEKMLQAYEKGDLDTIQKLGHLLKGTSSNLRINALSDTLYKIQFCEDSSNLEHYIKDYWGHFLSFEIQINALAK
ncbi:MAG: hypothetical protein OQK45_09335 [Sulfurovum sp.]|nr:hypothetical protein [Sulfurovum sp.]